MGNSFAKRGKGGGDMNTSVYDPAGLRSQILTNSISTTVANLQADAGMLSIVPGQVYHITDAVGGTAVIDVIGISTSNVAVIGTALYQNAVMSTPVIVYMDYTLTNDTSYVVRDPKRNNVVYGTNTHTKFPFDQLANSGNTLQFVSLTDMDVATTTLLMCHLENIEIDFGSHTGVIFQDFSLNGQGTTLTVPGNNITYGYNQSNTKKIAKVIAVNGAALATTSLIWESGIDLSTYMPMYAVFEYRSGTSGINVSRVLADTVPITANQAMLTLDATHNCISPCIAAVGVSNDSTKSLKVDVTTASLGASTFDVTVYGVPY